MNVRERITNRIEDWDDLHLYSDQVGPTQEGANIASGMWEPLLTEALDELIEARDRLRFYGASTEVLNAVIHDITEALT